MKIDLDELPNLSERSLAWHKIVQEVKRRGHWKASSRGVPVLKNLKRKSTDVDIQLDNSQQSTDIFDEFSEGL